MQFGAPPETIKDSVCSDEGVADVFVLTDRFFDYGRGISFAEVEFPIYYNFFVRQRRLRLLCTAKQRDRVERLMQEALFGPAEINLHPELPEASAECPWRPNLEAELAYFRRSPGDPSRPMQLDDLVQFVEFDDETGCVTLDGLEIQRLTDKSFRLIDGADGDAVTVPVELTLPQRTPESSLGSILFQPPELGVTVLGSGHGFDPKGRTTGFILWTHGQGIMVDPPVDARCWIDENQIAPRSVDSIILTHVHSDHDGGTLQQALSADRLRIYSTPTIYQSFLRKAEAVLGLPRERFDRIVEFVPLVVGTPMAINGAKFIFHYSLHSIPTIGFSCEAGGRSLVYSSDHLYDPALIEDLVGQRVLSRERADDLLSFPWDSDLVIHEAGVPPIHTSVEVLRQLPDETKQRMVLVHTTADAVPQDSGLRLAPLGLANTIDLKAAGSEVGSAVLRLRALRAVHHFADLPVAKALEFLETAMVRCYAAGESIVRKGEVADWFFVILSGRCVIEQANEADREFGMYEYFGEAALVGEGLRTADVRAVTDTELLLLSKEDFFGLIRGTDVQTSMKRLYENRDAGTWSLLDLHPVLSGLNTAQRSHFQSMLSPCEFADGEFLCRAGDEPPSAFLLAHGQVRVRDLFGASSLQRPGAFIGEVEVLVDGGSEARTVVAEGAVGAYRVERGELREFLLAYPGVYLRLLHDAGTREQS